MLATATSGAGPATAVASLRCLSSMSVMPARLHAASRGPVRQKRHPHARAGWLAQKAAAGSTAVWAGWIQVAFILLQRFARSMILSEKSATFRDHALASLSAVDDSDERGPWMKVHAGARMRARIGASPSSMRA